MSACPALNNLRIVLVHTKTAGNIGAVARCMMNMGLSRLVLVNPPRDIGSNAIKFAAGAEQIIDAAVRFDSLRDAVSDCGLVLGTSRHAGRRRKNINTPRVVAKKVVPLLSHNQVAIVFGDEVNGLTNEQIALCHELISIPSSGLFPSLNLSHAVMIVAYEFFIAAQTALFPAECTLVPSSELELFYEHLQRTLEKIGFLDRAKPEHMMFSLRQIFGRAKLDERELSILRGILNQMDKATKAQNKK